MSCIFSSFATDLLLLALMLIGILRLKETRQQGSVCRLLYMQVSHSHTVAVTLTLYVNAGNRAWRGLRFSHWLRCPPWCVDSNRFST